MLPPDEEGRDNRTGCSPPEEVSSEVLEEDDDAKDVLGRRKARRQSAETTNVIPSKAKAITGPTRVIHAAPSKGPSNRPSSRLKAVNAFAEERSSFLILDAACARC